MCGLPGWKRKARQLIESGKHRLLYTKNNAEKGFKQLDVRRRCCDTRAILRFGLAALKDGLYIEKARKSRFLGQKPPFGMTVCGVSAVSDNP
jgi:hypothetical protein